MSVTEESQKETQRIERGNRRRARKRAARAMAKPKTELERIMGNRKPARTRAVLRYYTIGKGRHEMETALRSSDDSSKGDEG